MTLTINMNYDIPSITQAQNALNAKYPGTTINLISLFNQASQVWSNVITGAKDASGNTIDWTTNITVGFKALGIGPLGNGGPGSGPAATLPTSGQINMNSNGDMLFGSLIPNATNSTEFLDTVIHEIAHALGYGTIWEDFKLAGVNADSKATTAVQGTYEYTGTNAIKAYQNLLNDQTLSFVPLETTSGDGSARAHWSATLFNGELMLMSPKNDYATPMPISTVTLASFEDLGYVVDLSKVAAYAGPYVDPSQQVTSKTPGTPTLTSLGFHTILPANTNQNTPTTRNTNTPSNAADPNFYKIVTYGTQPNGNPNGGANTANGNDFITKEGDNDWIYGFAGNDTIQSGAGDDLISGGAGNDVLDGGAGTDTALYADSWVKYDVTGNATSAQVVARAGAATDGGGTDQLSNIEKITFFAGDKTKAITVSIADAINVAPVAVADTFTMHANSVKGNILSNDTDANSLIVGLGETKTVTAVGIVGGSSTSTIAATGFTQVTGQNGILTIAANGEYTFSVTALPATGGATLSSFQYTMSDAHGLTSTSTLTFSTGSSTNVAPTLGTITANNVTQADAGKTSYSFDVAYSDSDGFIDQATIDAKDVTVTYNGNTLTVTGATWNATTGIATYTVTPLNGKWADTNSGTYTIGIVAAEVFDNLGASVVANPNAKTFTATIAPNTAPTLAAPTVITYTDTAFVDTFATKTGTLSSNDVDAGTKLTYGITGGIDITGYSVSKSNAYGTLTVTTATGAYSFVANSAAIEPLGANASDSTLTVTVSDGSLTASQAFTVNIAQSGVTETIGNDVLTGTAGNDVISSLAGDDVINGGAGVDTMTGGAGNDGYYVDNVGDVIVETAYAGALTQQWDYVYSSTATYTLSANVEALVLVEGSAATTAVGNTGYNYFVGNSAANIFDGKGGGDFMVGGKGNDAYDIYSSADNIVEYANEGWDTVWALSNYTLPVNVEALIFYNNAGNSNGYGNNSANYIVGNNFNNLLDGQAGNDSLTGGEGADTLVGSLGQDRYDLAETVAATDTLRIATGDSTVGFGNYDFAVGFKLGTGTVNTTGVDQLDLVNTTIASNAAAVNGTNAGVIMSHSITNGIISFAASDTYAAAPLTLSDGYLGNVFSYLQANITGNQTVGFVCSGNTFVFQDAGAVDTLVELVGVSATSLNTTGLAAGAVWIV
jgi:VCBS repeat-containing protein